MKYLFSLMALSLFTGSFLHAQGNYKPGYIINIHNDTLKGFIDYREWSKNPTTIKFKPNVNAQSENYTVNNANGFAINDLEYYKKFIVPVSKGNVAFDVLSHQLDTAYSIDTVFLKSLVNGKYVSLYSFTDKIKTRFYVLDNETRHIEELKYSLYFNEDVNSVVTLSDYRQQLLKLATTYQTTNDKLTSKIKSCQYIEGDLVRIFKAINGGTAQQITHSTLGSRFYAGLGARSSKLSFSGDNATFASSVSKASVSPVLSAGVDIFGNINTKKIFLRLNADFTSSHFKASNTEVIEVINVHKASTLDFKQYLFSFSPQVIYNFYSADKLKIFIGGGIALNIAAYNDYNYITTTNGGDKAITNKYPEFQKFYIAMPVKAGVFIGKHIELYGTYTLPSAITQNALFSVSISSVQAGINYTFGR
ncbi:MAG: hypothetical protein JWQ66_2295 [Mucilaginibacter sp.]|nr:hypothetical protein [Mucilaginibacter sp.]